MGVAEGEVCQPLFLLPVPDYVGSEGFVGVDGRGGGGVGVVLILAPIGRRLAVIALDEDVQVIGDVIIAAQKPGVSFCTRRDVAIVADAVAAQHEARRAHGAELERCRRAARQELGSGERSEEHTSELQSLMRISYAVFCLKKKK